MKTITATATDTHSYAIDLYDQSAGESLFVTDVPVQDKTIEHFGCTLVAALLIGVTTVYPTFTENTIIPTFNPTFVGAFQFQDQSQSNDFIPSGFEIHGIKKVRDYIKRYPYLKLFLENNLSSLKNITGTSGFAIEYEGLMEEGWENLYLVVYLEDYDDSYVSDLEDRIYNEWFAGVSDIIKRKLTVSFDWK